MNKKTKNFIPIVFTFLIASSIATNAFSDDKISELANYNGDFLENISTEKMILAFGEPLKVKNGTGHGKGDLGYDKYFFYECMSFAFYITNTNEPDVFVQMRIWSGCNVDLPLDLSFGLSLKETCKALNVKHLSRFTENSYMVEAKNKNNRNIIIFFEYRNDELNSISWDYERLGT